MKLFLHSPGECVETSTGPLKQYCYRHLNQTYFPKWQKEALFKQTVRSSFLWPSFYFQTIFCYFEVKVKLQKGNSFIFKMFCMYELHSAQKRGQWNHNLAITLSLTEYANFLVCEFSFSSATTLNVFLCFYQSIPEIPPKPGELRTELLGLKSRSSEAQTSQQWLEFTYAVKTRTDKNVCSAVSTAKSTCEILYSLNTLFPLSRVTGSVKMYNEYC